MGAFDSERALDETDWQLLREIQKNSRVSFSELGRRVGLTQPAVAERIHRLEEAGVIAGYRADLDLAKIGLPVIAFIRVATLDDAGANLEGLALSLPRIMECHRILGDDSYLLKVAASSVQELEEIIDRIRPCGRTTTSIVLHVPVAHGIVSAPEGVKKGTALHGPSPVHRGESL